LVGAALVFLRLPTGPSAAMGAGASAEVAEAEGVKVLNDCLYVDHRTRQQRHGQLASDAVHSAAMDAPPRASHDDLDGLQEALDDTEGREGSAGFTCAAPRCMGASRRTARELLSKALELVKAVGEEQKDLHDEDWQGPGGSDPLEQLFDTDDQEDIADAVKQLARGVQAIVSHEKRIQEVSAPVTVFGDIHGQLRDMLLLFHDFGFPHAHGEQFVFNGDWVDRGKHQIEVVSLVFALKITFPTKVFLNRGNHEDAEMNERYGFKDQCLERLGESDGLEAFEAVTTAFTYLPLGCRINGKVLVVHGGIGDGRWDLEDIEETSKPLTSDNVSEKHNWPAQNMLWSDPIAEDNPDGVVRGVHNSPRSDDGIIKTFGMDVTKSFLERNDLQLIIRSHEFVEDGHGYEVEHGGRLMRVFSARDYQGESGNGGAVLHLDLEDDVLCVQPQVLIALGKQQP